MCRLIRFAALGAACLLVASPVPGATLHRSLPPVGSLDGLGINIHFTDPKPGEIEMLAATGVKWVRMDLFWNSIEKQKGKYDFSAYDRLVAALDRVKIRAVLVLDYGNPLYAPPGNDNPYATQEFRDGYARWAVATVSHFAGKGFIWEMWNEPNWQTFWKPQPNADDYAALALAAGKALRAAGLCKDNQSGEALIGPACSLIDLPFLETCFKAGLLDYWCAVSMHPYRTKPPETVADDFRRVRSLIDTYAPDAPVPIISGEWGYSTAPPSNNIDEPHQASLLARELLTNIANDVPLSIWYDWRDDGGDPQNAEHHFGLVRIDYQGKSPLPYAGKPAYEAMKTLNQQLAGFTFNKQISFPAVDPNSDAVIDLFTRGAETRVVAWLRNGSRMQCALPVSNCTLHAVNCQGQPLPDQTISASSALVTLTDSPIYFTPGAPDPLLLAAASWQRAPLDVPCNAPDRNGLLLSFRNPLSQPISVKGMTLPLQSGASVRISSSPLAPARMPLDQYGEYDAQFRARRAALQLFSPACLLTQPFTAIVRNYVSISIPPPGDHFQLLQVSNPSGLPWQGQVNVLGDQDDLPYVISLPAGTRSQTLRMPVQAVSSKPGQQIEITAEGGTLVLPIPVTLPWSGLPVVVPGGNPLVGSTQSIAVANPPDGPSPSGTASFQLSYKFNKGWKFLRIDPAKPAPAIKGNPVAMGLWIYGDGQNCKFRGRFQDTTGQTFQLDGVQLAWRGWRYTQMSFTDQPLHWGGANDGQIHFPLTAVYLVLDGFDGTVKGEVYFSAPALIYPPANGVGAVPGVAFYGPMNSRNPIPAS